MNIYHGSMYDAETLKPGFQHTKELIEWDETESNKFLYACADRKMAILLGISSYFFNRFDVKSFNTDINENGKGGVLKFEFYTYPKVDLRKLNPTIYLYTLEKTKEWKEVNNKVNRLEKEYKTQAEVKPIDKKAINILNYLASENIVLDFKLYIK